MIHPLWKTCDCRRKMGNCVCEVYQRAANRRIWLLNDCIIHFWTYNVKQGDMERGEGRRRSRTREMWQNQGMCEKGGKTRLRWRYLGHTGLFFFKIARTICSVSATLDVQLLPFSRVTRLQWNYAATPYAEHAIILPKQQSDHSASLTSKPHKSPSLCSIFLDFAANWAEGLNQLNLSPVIIADYKHLDILLFRITERGWPAGW